MLQEQVWPVTPQCISLQNLLFIQDGATPHFANNVRHWLDEHFPGRWIGPIGRSVPHEWPAPSPDLFDSFLWGWAKEQAYLSKATNLNELEQSIITPCTEQCALR